MAMWEHIAGVLDYRGSRIYACISYLLFPVESEVHHWGNGALKSFKTLSCVFLPG